jgi:hypothetical protein
MAVPAWGSTIGVMPSKRWRWKGTHSCCSTDVVPAGHLSSRHDEHARELFCTAGQTPPPCAWRHGDDRQPIVGRTCDLPAPLRSREAAARSGVRRPRAAWLKKNSQARADDLLLAFSDPSVAAVISTIGGDDAIRLIRHVDLNVIRDHPKAFLGYSDGTVVNMMCYQAGLVSFYGVCMMVGFAENTGMHRYTADSVRRTLFSTAPPGLVTPHTEGWTDEFLDWADPSHQLRARTLEPPLPRRVLQGQGTVRGRLLGEAYRDLERASYVSQATAACS